MYYIRDAASFIFSGHKSPPCSGCSKGSLDGQTSPPQPFWRLSAGSHLLSISVSKVTNTFSWEQLTMIMSFWPPWRLTLPRLTRARHFYQYPPRRTGPSLPALTPGRRTERIYIFHTNNLVSLRFTSTLRFFSIEVWIGIPSLRTTTTPSTLLPDLNKLQVIQIQIKY